LIKEHGTNIFHLTTKPILMNFVICVMEKFRIIDT
jgi:hypothetical protein